MAWRLIRFLLFLLAGALAGAWAGIGSGLVHDRWAAAVVGLLLAALLWVAIDLARAYRVLKWLRSGDDGTWPRVPGLWGRAADRMRRLLRQRDRAVEESEGRLQEFLLAIQASPNGILLLDPANHIEWCNQTASQHWGIDPVRDRAQQVGHLLRDPAFAAYLAAGDFGHEVQVAGPRSSPARPLRLSVQLHRYSGQRKLMISRDVTALEQADAMRRDFVANVSHEIRTPLTVLTGFVETLQSLPLNEGERQRYLALMAQQGRRMQALVDDLLALSRLEGSPPPGEEDWVPMAQLLDQCESEARHLSAVLSSETHRISCVSEADSQVAGSAQELLSAMVNLVNNAVRYTPPGGEVRISWRVLPGGEGEFSVKDSGAGIAAEHIPRLTERFYRVDRSRSRDTGGTGLGLAIVKHVAQRHGAQLQIESRLGEGSVFRIVLPARRVASARGLG